jgi:hypothetical protein
VAFDPRKLDPAGFNWNGGQQQVLPTDDRPSAEPLDDIDAQLQDLEADSERRAVYLSPEQRERPQSTPEDAITIEDFDGKGGTLIAKDLETADYALDEQTKGRDMQALIGELTLAGSGKPADEKGALVVQKKTSEGAVQRESAVATPEEALALAEEWGEGTEITDVPSAVMRRKKLIQQAAKEQGLSAQLVANVMAQESGGTNYRTSSAGAQGLMQLMPGTAKELGVTDPFDPTQNVRGGATYLRQLLDKYDGDQRKALAAYNWGMGNVDKYLARVPQGQEWLVKGLGLPDETFNYVSQMGAGGMSEAIALQEAMGPQSATRESLDRVGTAMQAKNIGYLEEGPYSGLDFQERDDTAVPGTVGTGRIRPQDLDPAGFNWGGVDIPTEERDDYGWGFKNAFMRGLIRLGQMVDIAQGDVEEYTEGAELLKKYGVSEEDQARLEELQESDSFWEALGYYITNPALAMQVVLESLPMSTAPLLGGAAGAFGGSAVGPVGTIVGGAAGAGLGSFATEYLASIDEAMQEFGVDTTNPEDVKAFFADEEAMAHARELGAKRGIGVAAFDALSMGLAGRIYKPIKGLHGAATKTGAVVGGTSEVLAQSTAGALGELSAQKIAGQEYDPAAVAGEFVGEIVPGLGEIAINKLAGRDAAGNRPEDETTPAARDVPDVQDDSIPETGEGGASISKQVEEEAEDMVVKPPPEEEQTTTTDATSEKTASETQEEVVGEVPIEEMLKQAADKEEATEQAAIAEEETEEFKSVLINVKELAAKITTTFPEGKQSKPVRDAWRGVMKALQDRYPDVPQPPGGRFTGTGIARFFKGLQDQIDITKDLPEVRELLEQISTQEEVTDVINVLDRLASKIRDESPSLGAATPGSVAAQVQTEYNSFVPWFRSKVGESKAKRTKGEPTLKGTSKRVFAEKLGQFAGAVRTLVTEADKAGVLEMEGSGLSAEYGRQLELADQAMNEAMAPKEKKTKLKSGEVGKTKTIEGFRPASLIGIAEDLTAIAENLVPKLVEAEVAAAEAKKGKGKAKVEETSAVTEAPAKPKIKQKAEKPAIEVKKEKKAPKRDGLKAYAALKARAKELGIKTTGKMQELSDRIAAEEQRRGESKKETKVTVKKRKLSAEEKRNLSAGVLAQQAERQREIDEEFAADVKYDELPLKEEPAPAKPSEKLGELTPAQKIEQRKLTQELRAEVDEAINNNNADDLANKIRYAGLPIGYATVAQLRKIAKALGGKRYYKLPRLGVIDVVIERAEVVTNEHQRRGMAEEAAEIKADVEANIPKKYRKGHVYHAVRNIADVAGIVKNGLKKGSNLALDMLGQGVSMLGDVGNVVLVFADKKKDYTVKDYQNDGVAKGGMKPVAIVADSLNKEQIAELGKAGIPVFVGGKRVAAKAATAKKVRSAKPTEVLDPIQNIVGAEAGKFKRSMDAETIDEAFEKAGVSKFAAKKIRGLMAIAEQAGVQKEIVDAAYEFAETGNKLRFTTQIEAVLGKVPSPALLEAYTEFTLAINETPAMKAEREQSETTTRKREEDMERLLEQYTEKEIEAMRETGALPIEFDPDETIVDEWNVPISKRLEMAVRSTLGRISRKLSPAERKRVELDRRMMQRAMNKIRPQLAAVTDSETLAEQGLQPDKINMGEMIDLLLSAMPNNHRYTNLLKMLKKLHIDEVQVKLFENAFGLDPYGKSQGRHTLGVHPDGTVNPMGTSISVRYDPEHRHDESFIRTLLHEMVHAATSLRYYTDKRFRTHMNTLWWQAVNAFAKENPEFDRAGLDAELAKHQQNPLLVAKYIDNWLRSTPAEEGMHMKFYGLLNPLEMIAESFVNPYFQEFMNSVDVKQVRGLMPEVMRKVGARIKSLFDVFLESINHFIGISSRNTLLREVLVSSAANFDNYISYRFANRSFRPKKHKPSNMDDVEAAQLAQLQKDFDRDPRLVVKAFAELEKIKESRPPIEITVVPTEMAEVPTDEGGTAVDIDKKVVSSEVSDTADDARMRDSVFKQGVERVWGALRDLPEQANLGFMSRDQIERKYRDLFEWATRTSNMMLNPLTIYVKSKQASSVLAEKYAKKAHALLTKAQKLDNKTRSKLFRMMRNTTISQVWPHVSLQHKLNDHLWSKPNKKGVRKLTPISGNLAKETRQEWLNLKDENPTAADLLIEMAQLTKEIQTQKRITALRAVAQVYEVDETLLKLFSQLETQEDVIKALPNVYDSDGNILSREERPDKFVADKKDSDEVKAKKKEQLKEWYDLRNMARAAERIVEGTSIKGPYFPLRRYGNWVLASTEEYNDEHKPYVSFHNNKTEAARVAKKLKEKYGMDTKLTRKIGSYASPKDIESVVAELGYRMGYRGKKPEEGGMANRLTTAMYEAMADNVAYASQLKRENVDGVASDDMGRAFEEYVFVAKYTLGDLTTAYDINKALKDLKNLKSDNTGELSKSDPDKVAQLGLVVDELELQNREDAKDRVMSGMQKAVGLIGFFNFLGAPSYWVLNATQTLTVTLPYIGSKWGAKGTASYTRAAGTIFKAMKKARSYDEFKANLPEDAQKVVARLESEGIIQSTIAHEFGDMLSPSTMTKMIEKTGVAGRAATTGLRLMEKIPETVEKYNRISTALAIAELSDGDMVAVADGVQATQFNYDSANRARLLKSAPQWAGGGLRAFITPMMMFKTYGVGIARLLYGSMADVVLKKEGRAEAAKLAGGLILSHTFFGGVAGGIMMAPVQLIIWAFNQAFREAGEEFDPDEAVELFLQDNANDMVAALVSRGAPAALGIEMSKSINLGNLLWMGDDRIDLSKAGGVESALATGLGPVAQYAITSVREGHRLLTGHQKGDVFDFAAAIVPLKMLRGIIRGAKYEFYGVGTDTLTWIEPEDVAGWMRMAAGFRPTKIAMTADYEYNLIARDARRSERKSTLIDRALRADTPRKQAAVWDDIESFNRSLEKRKDWIRRGDVVRLRSRRRSRQRQHDRERR